MLSLVTAACIGQAAAAYNIDPVVIAAIMRTEGGTVGQYTENTNGTRDLGPMQINDDVWVGEVADHFFRGNERLAERELLNNGCFNVRAGAWILRRNIDLSDGDVLEGVGRYHSWTVRHKERYKGAFMRSIRSITGISRN
ncbi:lytic transglycosylase domain-containing protein [Salipiger mucosus]|uniref:BfpH n=1 Tax=Salipiger mucosus DSM 16094 TaxID=1123237 RepID=S9Q9M2_9RHOB|nr:lytic transglycosylase domain-containing protein [Salipiger mucosus]EPX78056.1 BfpH [Salipiger mucosus DSM 16094]